MANWYNFVSPITALENTGFWKDLSGKSAAEASNTAAADTFAKQQAAGTAIRGAGDQYNTDVGGLASNFDQYRSAGNSALQQLMAGLGLGGDQQGFTAAYRGLPGYQSGLDTGTQALQRGLNAGGVLNSGRAKALQRYGSDYEDQRSGDYLSRLMGLSNQGQAATGSATGLQAEGFRGRLGAETAAYGGDMNAAGTIGQGMVAGEQAKATALQNLLGTAAYVGGSFLGKKG